MTKPARYLLQGFIYAKQEKKQSEGKDLQEVWVENRYIPEHSIFLRKHSVAIEGNSKEVYQNVLFGMTSQLADSTAWRL